MTGLVLGNSCPSQKGLSEEEKRFTVSRRGIETSQDMLSALITLLQSVSKQLASE